MINIWIKIPPTEGGYYWVKQIQTNKIFIGKPIAHNEWFINGSEEYQPERFFMFGPKIPSPENLSKLYDKEKELEKIYKSWGFTPNEEQTINQ